MVFPLFLLVAAAAAQGQAQPPESPFSGTWTGSAKLGTEGGPSSCRYVGQATPPSVTVAISPGADSGTISLALPPAGANCGGLTRDGTFSAAEVVGNRLSFKDDHGVEWVMTLREGQLVGMASGGLSGEVELSRKSPAGASAAAASSGERVPVTKPGKGPFVMGVGGIIAANVVGLGAIVGLHEILKDKQGSSTAQANCSPRTCVVVVNGGECQCSGNITVGGQCGSTANGVAYAGVCSIPGLPCQSNLSCNNGLCEDNQGRCPF